MSNVAGIVKKLNNKWEKNNTASVLPSPNWQKKTPPKNMVQAWNLFPIEMHYFESLAECHKEKENLCPCAQIYRLNSVTISQTAVILVWSVRRWNHTAVFWSHQRCMLPLYITFMEPVRFDTLTECWGLYWLKAKAVYDACLCASLCLMCLNIWSI